MQHGRSLPDLRLAPVPFIELSLGIGLGGVIAGWGLFNVVEGVVDHQVLGVHHVRDDLGGPLSTGRPRRAVQA